MLPEPRLTPLDERPKSKIRQQARRTTPKRARPSVVDGTSVDPEHSSSLTVILPDLRTGGDHGISPDSTPPKTSERVHCRHTQGAKRVTP